MHLCKFFRDRKGNVILEEGLSLALGILILMLIGIFAFKLFDFIANFDVTDLFGQGG